MTDSNSANTYSIKEILSAIKQASKVLSSRKEEINRLNVFPVPDGDTGTNMSLTIESVVNNINKLPQNASDSEVKKAITTGALMGARGNSGVITSQILRGLCEGWDDGSSLTTKNLADAFAKAEEVAFQAVRKPVEGTILTVLKDIAYVANESEKDELDVDDALANIVNEGYASVQRTPDYLSVLKENGVVDAGGFGLAILIDAFAAAIAGRTFESDAQEFDNQVAPKVEIENINDWEDANFRYCNEFLVDSDTLNTEEALDFLSTMGDCELCVGSTPKFKVHVHSDNPDKVLRYFLDRGQISEVHIHNMDMQSKERLEKLAQDDEAASGEHKNIGVVAVCSGEGNASILKSLNVDKIVLGGQTMNPSTKDLLDAAESINADSIIILPNNSNIIMAANSAAENCSKPCGVVPTKSIPQSFASMFVFDENATLDENIDQMSNAASEVKTGEITFAIKDSKDAHNNPISEGDVIGIADGSIESVGKSIEEVTLGLLKVMDAEDLDTMTILAGQDFSDEDLEKLTALIEENYEDLELDPQRGGQPLYPVIFSLE